jgi:flagellar assembly protein FliH
MSSSNLIRGDAIALVNERAAAMGAPITVPRIVGARVLRGDHVGLQRPMPLAVPVVSAPLGSQLEEAEEEAAPLPPPPDLSEIEEAARLEGYNAGFQQGHAAGIAAAEESMAQSVHRLAALVSSIHENHTAFFRAAERQVVDLALQIAQKVVERELENMPDMAVNVIRGALEEMDARTALRVRVNPDDEEVLRRRWAQVVPPGVVADRIELQPDERVQPGGGIIETTHGQVDAQLESKLAQLGNALWTFVMDVSSAQAGDSPEGTALGFASPSSAPSALSREAIPPNGDPSGNSGARPRPSGAHVTREEARNA